MKKKGLSLRVSSFQKGPHGYSLANEACADGSSQVIDRMWKNGWIFLVEWIFSVFGQLEFRDISTSHIMDAIKELGIHCRRKPQAKG